MQVGVDLVKISRVERFVEKFGDRALEKFLSSDEIVLAKSSSTIAGFWATKEAVSKALGTGIGKKCSFFDIKIKKEEGGKPYFLLSKRLVDEFGIKGTSLSISHDGDYAVAVCSIEMATCRQKDLSF